MGRVTNVRLEFRNADGHSERLPELVRELIDLKPDALLVAVTPDALAAANATKTIPIVMASPGYPVPTQVSLPASARPGGNVTGLTPGRLTSMANELQFLKEVAPNVARLAVLWNPEDTISALTWQQLHLPALGFGCFELHSLEVTPGMTSSTRHSPVQSRGEGRGPNDSACASLCGQCKTDRGFRVAATIYPIFPSARICESPGGVLSYGPDRADLFRRAASLRRRNSERRDTGPSAGSSSRPSSELVINLKTAKALAL